MGQQRRTTSAMGSRARIGQQRASVAVGADAGNRAVQIGLDHFRPIHAVAAERYRFTRGFRRGQGQRAVRRAERSGQRQYCPVGADCPIAVKGIIGRRDGEPGHDGMPSEGAERVAGHEMHRTGLDVVQRALQEQAMCRGYYRARTDQHPGAAAAKLSLNAPDRAPGRLVRIDDDPMILRADPGQNCPARHIGTGDAGG